jgi:hypothetical protein
VIDESHNYVDLILASSGLSRVGTIKSVLHLIRLLERTNGELKLVKPAKEDIKRMTLNTLEVLRD